ncbi:ubiquinol-cytochrome c reductase cytochrome c1 subunit [Tistlia consotensis]|uniref:Cytochrome c1 n=1 Tax=Tistlia consotensis USBA 355 TaxID=560819 RepID=A0A1Y6CBC1_9PROT|nr:cytochrome c1 [Tistlia consotensis]SMF46459.1 ubiquinol-cytochrome c reductase cytochrome c1 subunit [Tistlia consotensis USBA 355]SNR78397.1 ubiquinol-cytochrome c reductase cytochrome c1 subunit [Tistlia consotensis]
MRKTVLSLAVAAVLALGAADSARAAGEIKLPPKDWSFDGVFGTFDPAALQRGLQVFKNVCSACHGLDFVAFRNLAALGYDDDQIKKIAADFQVQDGPNDQGEMFMRPAVPSDRWPSPFANEQAARVANGGALPPDLSLMAKARAGGPTYIYNLIGEGFVEPPAGVEVTPGKYYNKYFPGHMISMPPPLSEGVVEYADGTKATVPQMAEDVSTFLMWAAEPNLIARKRMGIKVILFLIVLTGLLYAVKRRVWSDVAH